MGLKSIPSKVQLPGGISLKAFAFKVVAYTDDGCPKTFELVPTNEGECTLWATEEYMRRPIVKTG